MIKGDLTAGCAGPLQQLRHVIALHSAPAPRTGTLPLLPSSREQRRHCALVKGQEEAASSHMDSTAGKGVYKEEKSGMGSEPHPGYSG